MTASEPRPLPQWFFLWAKWRDGNRKGPRPQTPIPIPPWAWQRYAKHLGTPKPPAKPPITPPPPAPIPVHAVKPIMFTAEAPMLAIRTPLTYRIGLSADPGFRDAATHAAFDLCARGYELIAWCDCSSTPASEAVALRDQLKLDGWCGQAETSAQFDQSLAAGATEIVGSADALTPDQLKLAIELVDAGKLVWWQEAYWGDATQVPPHLISARGIGAAGLAIGVYSRTRPHTLADYYADLPSLRGCCSIFDAEGMTDGDWMTLVASE